MTDGWAEERLSRSFREVGAVRWRAGGFRRRALTILPTSSRNDRARYGRDPWASGASERPGPLPKMEPVSPLLPGRSHAPLAGRRSHAPLAGYSLQFPIPFFLEQLQIANCKLLTTHWPGKPFASPLPTIYNCFCLSPALDRPKPVTMMSSAGSVTHLIEEMKAGNPQALEEVYRSYFPRLLALARKKLVQLPRRVEDEEDVVQSVFRGFCKLAERGLYPSLRDRNDLWVLLFCMTARKIGRLRRNKLPTQGEGSLQAGRPDADDEVLGLELLLDHEPTPEEAAAFAEDVQRRMDDLKDDILRQVAQYKMENFTDEEIAQKLGCVTRTIERKLRLIRTLWEQMES